MQMQPTCDVPVLHSLQNMLRQQEEENGAAWSISSESSDDSSSPQLSGSARHVPPRPVVQPAVQATAPAIEIAFTQPEEKEPPPLREEVTVANGHVPYARTLSQISEASVDLPVAEDRECPVPRDCSPKELPPLETNSLPQRVDLVLDAPISEAEEQEAKPTGATPTAEGSKDTVCRAQEVPPPSPAMVLPASREPQPTGVSEAPRPKPVDCGLEEAIASLGSALDDYRGQFPELQTLEQELKHLEAILLVSEGGGTVAWGGREGGHGQALCMHGTLKATVQQQSPSASCKANTAPK